MIDKIIEKAEKVFDWSNENNVYVALAICRSKYNPDIGNQDADHKKGDAVFREVLKEHNYKQKLQKLYVLMQNYENGPVQPEFFNLYLTFNPRDSLKALLELQKDFIKWRENDNEHLKAGRVDSYWTSCLQKIASRASRNYYLVDIDTKKHTPSVAVILGQLSDPKTWIEFRSRNGTHILSPPFNVQEFEEKIREKNLDAEIKTDALVSLHYGT